MKHIVIVLFIGLLARASALSQGTVIFDINFGATPPPHSVGVPFSGAMLSNDLFYAILYLDTTEPVSGSIQSLNGGTLTTVFKFTNLVFAGYPGGGIALDYEGSWQLTDTQIQNLLAGQWYANVTYSDASYTGQIVAVPEPSSAALGLGGLMMVAAYLCRGTALSKFAKR